MHVVPVNNVKHTVCMYMRGTDVEMNGVTPF